LFYSSPPYSKLNAEWPDAAAVVVDFAPAVWAAASAAQLLSVDSEALPSALRWVVFEARQLAVSEAPPWADLGALQLAGLEARRLVDLGALPASERSRPRREAPPAL
jgi:hypothetical protein